MKAAFMDTLKTVELKLSGGEPVKPHVGTDEWTVCETNMVLEEASTQQSDFVRFEIRGCFRYSDIINHQLTRAHS